MARGCSRRDRKSTRLNSSHLRISYAVFCLKTKVKKRLNVPLTKEMKMIWIDVASSCQWRKHTPHMLCSFMGETKRFCQDLMDFFLKVPGTPGIYTLPHHDAFPI